MNFPRLGIHEYQLCDALLQHVLKGKFTILSKPSQHGMRPSWTWPIFVVQSDSHIQRDILPTAIHLTHFYRFCHFGHPCHRSSMLFLLLTHIASAVMQIWAWKSHSYASSKSIGVAFGRNCGCRETFEFRWNSRSSGRHWCTKRCNGWYLQRSRLHFSARNLFSSKVPCQYLPLARKYLSHKVWPLSDKFYKKLSSCLRLKIIMKITFCQVFPYLS